MSLTGAQDIKATSPRRATQQTYITQSLGFSRQTELGSIVLAAGYDANTETARAGKCYMGGCQVIGNGIAPDTAIPTTTAQLALYNGDTSATGAKCILVESVSFALGQGTPTAGAALFLSTSTAIVAAASVPTMATNYAAGSCSGSSTASIAIWGASVTLPTATKWSSAGSQLQLAAANVGQGDTWIVPDGGILLRPGYAMGISILSGAGTVPLYVVSAFWSEFQLDVE